MASSMKTACLVVIFFASLIVATAALRLRRPTTKAAVVGCQDNEGRSYKVGLCQTWSEIPKKDFFATFFRSGEDVESSDPCETMCTCGPQGSIICAVVDCLPCRGKVVPVEGQCCGDCYVHDILILPGTGCKKNDTLFEYGSSIPTDNPCESCYCNEMDGVMCAMMMCAPCRPPLKNMADGSCCGECRDVTTLPVLGGCVVDGNNYKVGDLIPGDNPCESCYCGARNEPECSSMACEACPTNMHHVSVPGSCCGECHDVRIQPVIGCAVNGNQYAVGPFTDSRDACKECICNKDGTFRCRKKKCPKLKCKKSLITGVDGQCCQVCKCEHNGQIYMPGPVEDVCESLVCENGAVTLSRPATCTNIELKCVDPQLGENCCPYCPNGSTCQVGKTVISVGEFKKVGKKICTCYTDPWFPNAFCAQKKVNASLKKNYGQHLADYRSLLQEL